MIATVAFTLASLLTLRLILASFAWARGASHAFEWKRTFRRGPDDPPYMIRRQLIRSPWVDVYVNHILRPDYDPNPHNHPWRESYSVKLLRQYVEQVYWGPGCCMSYFRTPARFSRVPNIHRIVDAPKRGAWTLFVGVGRRGSWGFFDLDDAGKFYPHDQRGHNG